MRVDRERLAALLVAQRDADLREVPVQPRSPLAVQLVAHAPRLARTRADGKVFDSVVLAYLREGRLTAGTVRTREQQWLSDGPLGIG